MSTRRSEAERLIEEAIGLVVANNMCEIIRRLRQQCGNGVANLGVVSKFSNEKQRPLLHPDTCMQFIYLAEKSSKKPDEIFTDFTE
jgi:hypothetical protein